MTFFARSLFLVAVTWTVTHALTSQQQLQLARQTMLQQDYVHHVSRTTGDSGIRQVRHNFEGTESYHSDHFAGESLASIHDHANNIRTIGMGEVIAVLNGVEFLTRHNDFRLRMPSRSSLVYGETEDIPFPSVPPSVLRHPDIDGQIKEMQEYFKAWKTQNSKLRDYQKYFKPVLCYLEAGWTVTGPNIDEPFYSDRHHLEAKTWEEMQEKMRFVAYTGGKDIFENFAYLPTTIIDVDDRLGPIYAQWNYRILCHPLKNDLPTNRFKVVDDVSSRMRFGRSLNEHTESRAARFQLNPFDTDEWQDGKKTYGLLDKLMSEIPGKDMYNANLRDEPFGKLGRRFNETDTPLNAAFYHRWYKSDTKGAMGLTSRHRGFSDQNLFMAKTTQNKIAGMTAVWCHKEDGWESCVNDHQKWTYAIPLEIIYLTPLLSWNPCGLQYKGNDGTPAGETVTAGGRNGDLNSRKAYNGTNSKIYYKTPANFFDDDEVGVNKADTTKSIVGVLDWSGNVQKVRASGTRIFLPNIPGVGVLRQRYPIVPAYDEGNPIQKELEALKDMVLNPKKFDFMLGKRDEKNSENEIKREKEEKPTNGIFLKTSEAGYPWDDHVHSLYLSPDQVQRIKKKMPVDVKTDRESGHTHRLGISYTKGQYTIDTCDYDLPGQECFDKHSMFLQEVCN